MFVVWLGKVYACRMVGKGLYACLIVGKGLCLSCGWQRVCPYCMFRKDLYLLHGCKKCILSDVCKSFMLVVIVKGMCLPYDCKRFVVNVWSWKICSWCMVVQGVCVYSS